MAYGTVARIRSRLSGGVSGDSNSYIGNAQVTDEFLANMQVEASDIIDLYLETSYPDNFPYASGDEPSIIGNLAVGIATELAREYMYPGPEPLKKARITKYEQYIQMLEKIASYQVNIQGLSMPYDRVYHTHEGYAPAVNVDDELNWAFDTDLLDEIEDDRG